MQTVSNQGCQWYTLEVHHWWRRSRHWIHSWSLMKKVCIMSSLGLSINHAPTRPGWLIIGSLAFTNTLIQCSALTYLQNQTWCNHKLNQSHLNESQNMLIIYIDTHCLHDLFLLVVVSFTHVFHYLISVISLITIISMFSLSLFCMYVCMSLVIGLLLKKAGWVPIFETTHTGVFKIVYKIQLILA